MFKWLVVVALLAGCSSGQQRVLPPPAVGSSVPEGMARITVRRTDEVLFLGLGADIAVNDQSLGSIFRGESTGADVPAGLTTVAVNAFGSPGRFVLRFPTVSSGHYDLQVAPRGSSFMPVMLYGYLGAAVDASANPEQGGSFTLAIVSAQPPIGTPPVAQSGFQPPGAAAIERVAYPSFAGFAIAASSLRTSTEKSSAAFWPR
jgi:hypothetical protein